MGVRLIWFSKGVSSIVFKWSNVLSSCIVLLVAPQEKLKSLQLFDINLYAKQYYQVLVTIHGVWIDIWIYWTLVTVGNCNSFKDLRTLQITVVQQT
jgi:hypothetical protein